MNDEIQIKELVSRYVKAIETQDKESFYQIWANNSNCILISITKIFEGKDSIYQDFLIGSIQKAYTTIKLIAEEVEVHKINSELATVVFSYHTECIKREDGSEYGIKGLETQVIIKENGQWKILHVHYSK